MDLFKIKQKHALEYLFQFYNAGFSTSSKHFSERTNIHLTERRIKRQNDKPNKRNRQTKTKL